MLDNNDIKVLRGMFKENNASFRLEIRQEIREAFEQNNADLKRDIRDEMHSLLKASEGRVISTICDFIDSSLLPQITTLQEGNVLIKRHLKLI